jgi:hypothetical protein
VHEAGIVPRPVFAGSLALLLLAASCSSDARPTRSRDLADALRPGPDLPRLTRVEATDGQLRVYLVGASEPAPAELTAHRPRLQALTLAGQQLEPATPPRRAPDLQAFRLPDPPQSVYLRFSPRPSSDPDELVDLSDLRRSVPSFPRLPPGQLAAFGDHSLSVDSVSPTAGGLRLGLRLANSGVLPRVIYPDRFLVRDGQGHLGLSRLVDPPEQVEPGQEARLWMDVRWRSDQVADGAALLYLADQGRAALLALDDRPPGGLPPAFGEVLAPAADGLVRPGQAAWLGSYVLQISAARHDGRRTELQAVLALSPGTTVGWFAGCWAGVTAHAEWRCALRDATGRVARYVGPEPYQPDRDAQLAQAFAKDALYFELVGGEQARGRLAFEFDDDPLPPIELVAGAVRFQLD